MRIIFNVRHGHTTRLNFRDIPLISTSKLVFEVKTSICSTIRESLILYWCNFLAFVVVIII